MCDKAVDICSFVIDSVLDQYKTQEMCDKVVSKDPFMVKYCLDRYKTQEIRDKAVDAFLPTLKFVPDWFVLSNMIKKHDDGLFSNDDIIFIHEDSNNVTFFSDEMGVLSVDFNTINLMMLIFVKIIMKLLFISDLWFGLTDLNNVKHLKKK